MEQTIFVFISKPTGAEPKAFFGEPGAGVALTIAEAIEWLSQQQREILSNPVHC